MLIDTEADVPARNERVGLNLAAAAGRPERRPPH